MTAPQALRLARVTGAQARALTVIARRGTHRLFTPGLGARADKYAGPWRIGMRPATASVDVDVDANAVAGAACRFVSLDWNGATFSLRLSARVCDDWLAVRLPDLSLDALPMQFIDAAWEAMIREALRELGLEKLCTGIRITADGAPGRHAEYPYIWTLSVTSAETVRTIAVELAVDDTGLQCLADLLSRWPVPDPEDYGCVATSALAASDARDETAIDLNKLAIRVQAKVGETSLDTAALRELQVGDAVLFDRCLSNLDGEVWLTTPDGQGVLVRASEKGASRYVVTQEWNLLMNDLSRDPLDEDDVSFGSRRDDVYGERYDAQRDDAYAGSFGTPRDDEFADSYDTRQDSLSSERHDASSGFASYEDDTNTAGTASATPTPASDNGLDVDRIPVRLSFDLGEQMLTLGELRRLQPGEYFDLQRRIDSGPLQIRANGTLVGTAELVDIEGRIGARILTLTLDPHSCS